MKRTKKIYLALLAVLLSPMAANADLIGAEVGLQGYSPDTSTLSQDFGSATVGDEVEFDAGGFSIHSFDLTASQLIIRFAGSGSVVFFNSAFNGFRLYDFDGLLGDIVSVTFNSGFGYTDGNSLGIVFDTDNIWINFAGLSGAPEYFVKYDIGTRHTVPEPGTLALLGLGLVGMAARRKTKV